MSLPTVEDINATRLTRFDDAITGALASDKVDFFRQVVAHYVDEYNVPEADVAAALAVVVQGDEPMLLEPEPIRPPRQFDRAGRDGRDGRDDRGERPRRGDRGDRGERPRRGASRGGSSGPLATYRISVGKRHRVEPRQIVGAIANEGGLERQDFGHIDIRADHSLVELPATLPSGAWDALRATRISGQLIELSLDEGRGASGGYAKKGHRKGPST